MCSFCWFVCLFVFRANGIQFLLHTHSWYEVIPRSVFDLPSDTLLKETDSPSHRSHCCPQLPRLGWRLMSASLLKAWGTDEDDLVHSCREVQRAVVLPGLEGTIYFNPPLSLALTIFPLLACNDPWALWTQRGWYGCSSCDRALFG